MMYAPSSTDSTFVAVNKAKIPCSRPEAVNIPKTGVITLVMVSTKVLTNPFFSSSASIVFPFNCSWTTWKISATFVPTTTWNRPLANCALMTSGDFTTSSFCTSESSFKVKRSRVIQCVTLNTFSFPPTFSKINDTKAWYLSMLLPPFLAYKKGNTQTRDSSSLAWVLPA